MSDGTHELDQANKPRVARGVTMGACAATLVIGMAAGLLAGSLVFGDDAPASADSADVAAAHVDVACGIALRVNETHTSADDFGGLRDDPVFWEVPALGYLMSAAAIHDAQYERFAAAGEATIGNIQRMNLDEFVSAAVEQCEQD
ncbi:hypothetical protein G1H11_21570 [Phytoactinopolyspora alkaliphila]|uniref:Uncharacterized protein n=1 Tax=Phytoactinopolyspora alkaliphila TaxID=1783498 RepID=A0A6N9YSD4_9ACTN|nr:hypothetical protein [Phytoactinopolyspora alkaliphila]NED97892.1 hypothetical protein [Phytoactinopolyspora alkaliphila]